MTPAEWGSWLECFVIICVMPSLLRFAPTAVCFVLSVVYVRSRKFVNRAASKR